MADTRPVRLGRLDCEFIDAPDGSTVIRHRDSLPAYPERFTSWLEHWAREAPDRVYLARRDHGGGDWVRVTYAEALAKVRALGAALLARGLGPERPVAILSGNGIEHALMALAAMHVGVPYSPISVAYSLVSTDFAKLRAILDLLTPGMVFVDDEARFARAIAATVAAGTEIVAVENASGTPFADLLAFLPLPLRERAGVRGETTPNNGVQPLPQGEGGSKSVDAAASSVTGDTVAKLLFTSGSTGTPKGVINTNRMLCANQTQIAVSLPFLTEQPPVLVDWTPWNHTFGGNHDFGLVLANGGTLYIDDGKPVPGLVEESIRNLREIAPTFYLNVPKGYEELVKYLKREPALCATFFSRVQCFFYAGAAIAQHVWDELDALAIETIGQKVQMLAGFGSTETAPFALICRHDCATAGVVGLPSPGIELKLVPVADKREARIRGPNITPGYWRNPEKTAEAFDAEGFYGFGDAMRWVDPARRELGLMFDGRLTEDFKLATGTWVSVGPLRARLMERLGPYLRDAVIAGINRDYVSVLVVPDPVACAAHPDLAGELRFRLAAMAREATGSAARVMRAIVLTEPPSIDAGEITDKGSINQRAVLTRRAALVADLYADPPPPHVIAFGATPMNDVLFSPSLEGGAGGGGGHPANGVVPNPSPRPCPSRGEGTAP